MDVLRELDVYEAECDIYSVGREILRRVCPQLLDCLELDVKLLACLSSSRVISLSDVEEINATVTTHGKVAKLVSIMNRRPLSKFYRLIVALGQVGQYTPYNILVSHLNAFASKSTRKTPVDTHISPPTTPPQGFSCAGGTARPVLDRQGPARDAAWWEQRAKALSDRSDQDQKAGTEEETCAVCCVNKKRTVYTPCGHAVCCLDCASRCSERTRDPTDGNPLCITCKGRLNDILELFIV